MQMVPQNLLSTVMDSAEEGQHPDHLQYLPLSEGEEWLVLPRAEEAVGHESNQKLSDVVVNQDRASLSEDLEKGEVDGKASPCRHHLDSLIYLGCGCSFEVGVPQKKWDETKFRFQSSRKCEIHGEIAQNVKLPNHTEKIHVNTQDEVIVSIAPDVQFPQDTNDLESGGGFMAFWIRTHIILLACFSLMGLWILQYICFKHHVPMLHVILSVLSSLNYLLVLALLTTLSILKTLGLYPKTRVLMANYREIAWLEGLKRRFGVITKVEHLIALARRFEAARLKKVELQHLMALVRRLDTDVRKRETSIMLLTCSGFTFVALRMFLDTYFKHQVPILDVICSVLSDLDALLLVVVFISVLILTVARLYRKIALCLAQFREAVGSYASIRRLEAAGFKEVDLVESVRALVRRADCSKSDIEIFICMVKFQKCSPSQLQA